MTRTTNQYAPERKTVKASALNNFINTAASWIQSNPQNMNHDICKTIMKFAFENRDLVFVQPQQNGAIRMLLQEHIAIGQRNVKSKLHKHIELCDCAKVSIISNKPGNDVEEFTFNTVKGKNKLTELHACLDAIDADSKKETADYLNTDVSYIPVYGTTIPDSKILPTDVLKEFIGFVVEDTPKLSVTRDLKK